MSEAAVPSPGLIQAKLRDITERLASELGSPQSAAPRWDDLEWRLAQAAAAMHGVSPLLRTSLRWRGPPCWEDFLIAQRTHTHQRQRRIAALIECIDEQAQRKRLGVMPLKGAALHALGVYAPGERPMADLDLLVSADCLGPIAQVLSTLGYPASGATWKHLAFEPSSGGSHAPLGEHADNAVKIDVHARIAERLPLAPIDFTDLILPTDWHAGLNAYPSRAALMLHVLAHAAGTMVSRGLRLIHVVDVVRLARSMSETDWRELLDRGGARKRLWWAHPPLALAARYFPGAIPARALDRLVRQSPWLLRRATARRSLADLSYAHVFIDPLSGLVWTRTPAELIRYIGGRIRPSREQLAQFELASRTGPWSASPEWYAQSHARRIWRWLTSRPTRIESMQPVRNALGR
jgi:hypothetical protein